MSKMRLTAGWKATVVRGLRWEARRFARAEDEARDRRFEGRSILATQAIVPLHPAFSRLQYAETLILVARARHDRRLLTNDALADNLRVDSVADRIVDQPAAAAQLRADLADVLHTHAE